MGKRWQVVLTSGVASHGSIVPIGDCKNKFYHWPDYVHA